VIVFKERIIPRRKDAKAQRTAAKKSKGLTLLGLLCEALAPLRWVLTSLVPFNIAAAHAQTYPARTVLAQLEHACEKALQSDTFITPAKRMHAKLAYLGSAAFRARAIEDWRYKGELIRALEMRME
jgi:hypothetical protein